MFRGRRFAIVVAWSIVVTLLITPSAKAYIGPGAGMEFIGYAMSLIALVGVAFLSILMWPFYAFIRLIRGNKSVPESSENPAPAAAEADAPSPEPTVPIASSSDSPPPAPTP